MKTKSSIKLCHPIRNWILNNLIIDHPVCELELTLIGTSTGWQSGSQVISKIITMNMDRQDGWYVCNFNAKFMFEKEVDYTLETKVKPISMFGRYDFKVIDTKCVFEHVPRSDHLPYKPGKWYELFVVCQVLTENNWVCPGG